MYDGCKKKREKKKFTWIEVMKTNQPRKSQKRKIAVHIDDLYRP